MMKRFIFLITFLFLINISIISNQAFAEENKQSDKPVSESNISNIDIAKYENEDLLTNLGTDNSSNEDVEDINNEESNSSSDAILEESEKINANDTVNNENNKDNSEKQNTQSENNTNEKANLESEKDVESTDKNVIREDKQASKVIDDDSEEPFGLNKDEDIIGTDDRKIVVDINKKPYKSIVFIKSYFNDRNYISGTGFMIDDYSVLTAAHVVTSEDKSINIKNILVFAGYQNEVAKFGTARVIKTYVPLEWSQSYNRKYDMALLLLDKPLGKKIGKLNIIDKVNLNEDISISGYPGINYSIDNQYYSSGKLLKENNYRLFYDIDTEPGQSGSPVFNSNNDVIGIHASGFTNKHIHKLNSAVKLTSHNIEMVKEWNNELVFKDYNKIIYINNNETKIWKDLNFNNEVHKNEKLKGRIYRASKLYIDSKGNKYLLIRDKKYKFLGFIDVNDTTELELAMVNKVVQLNKNNFVLYQDIFGGLQEKSKMNIKEFYKVIASLDIGDNHKLYVLNDKNKQYLGVINNYDVKEVKFEPYNKCVEIIKNNYYIFSDLIGTKDVETNSIIHKVYKAKGIYIDNLNRTILKIYDCKDKFVGYIDKEAIKIL
ncbi:trypsin-like peptidase domain-containing protein [Mammaliicoccus sciuri]|uniref:trypsin-like serine peptidase n=1 Tax=Mammaliicoccus sciuri TaxID=1296 RepID=UPI003F54C3C7